MTATPFAKGGHSRVINPGCRSVSSRTAKVGVGKVKNNIHGFANRCSFSEKASPRLIAPGAALFFGAITIQMATALASIATPSAGSSRPRGSSTKRWARATTVVTRGAAGGAGVEASTDGKHKDAAMAALDNCVTSSNLSVGDKYEAGRSRHPFLSRLPKRPAPHKRTSSLFEHSRAPLQMRVHPPVIHPPLPVRRPRFD